MPNLSVPENKRSSSLPIITNTKLIPNHNANTKDAISEILKELHELANLPITRPEIFIEHISRLESEAQDAFARKLLLSKNCIQLLIDVQTNINVITQEAIVLLEKIISLHLILLTKEVKRDNNMDSFLKLRSAVYCKNSVLNAMVRLISTLQANSVDDEYSDLVLKSLQVLSEVSRLDKKFSSKIRSKNENLETLVSTCLRYIDQPRILILTMQILKKIAAIPSKLKTSSASQEATGLDVYNSCSTAYSSKAGCLSCSSAHFSKVISAILQIARKGPGSIHSKISITCLDILCLGISRYKLTTKRLLVKNPEIIDYLIEITSSYTVKDTSFKFLPLRKAAIGSLLNMMRQSSSVIEAVSKSIFTTYESDRKFSGTSILYLNAAAVSSFSSQTRKTAVICLLKSMIDCLWILIPPDNLMVNLKSSAYDSALPAELKECFDDGSDSDSDFSGSDRETSYSKGRLDVYENFDMEKFFPEQKSLVQDRLITSKKLPLKEHIENVYKNTKTIKSFENVLGDFDVLNWNHFSKYSNLKLITKDRMK